VHGIYHANRGGRILNNLVYHNRAYGIHLWHAASDVVILAHGLNNGSSGLVVVQETSPRETAPTIASSQQYPAYNARYGSWNPGIPVPTTVHQNLTYENKLGSFSASKR